MKGSSLISHLRRVYVYDHISPYSDVCLKHGDHTEELIVKCLFLKGKDTTEIIQVNLTSDSHPLLARQCYHVDLYPVTFFLVDTSI